MTSFFSILRLIRLPNILTAISNVWAGILLTSNGNFQIPVMLFATVVATGLYSGGMTLNDYFDLNYDRVYNPDRPIPSGKVSSQNAMLIGIILLLIGIAGGFLISSAAGVIALVIALSAALYDSILKKWMLTGMISMGLCRGMLWVFGLEVGIKGYYQLIIIPVAIFFYTAGLIVLSRYEDKKPIIKQILTAGIILIPVIDGSIVLSFGYWWQGLIIIFLVVPVVFLNMIFKMKMT